MVDLRRMSCTGCMYFEHMCAVSKEDDDYSCWRDPNEAEAWREFHEKASQRGVVEGESGGKKTDLGKPDWSLLPLDAIEEAVKVLTFGATKYSRDNWKNLKRNRVYAAIFRHLKAYQDNPDKLDDETGMLHVSHALCEMIFLTWMIINNKGE